MNSRLVKILFLAMLLLCQFTVPSAAAGVHVFCVQVISAPPCDSFEECQATASQQTSYAICTQVPDVDFENLVQQIPYLGPLANPPEIPEIPDIVSTIPNIDPVATNDTVSDAINSASPTFDASNPGDVVGGVIQKPVETPNINSNFKPIEVLKFTSREEYRSIVSKGLSEKGINFDLESKQGLWAQFNYLSEILRRETDAYKQYSDALNEQQKKYVDGFTDRIQKNDKNLDQFLNDLDKTTSKISQKLASNKERSPLSQTVPALVSQYSDKAAKITQNLYFDGETLPSKYELKSPDGPFKKELSKVQDDLIGAVPQHRQGKIAQSIGLYSVQMADSAFVSGRTEDAEFYKHVAIGMTDIALGFIPVVGWGKDVYEAFSGRSLLTGEELDSFSRGMAIFGAVTVGIGSEVYRGAKALRLAEEAAIHFGKFGAKEISLVENAIKIGVKTPAELKVNANLLSHILPHFSLTNIEDAVVKNKNAVLAGMEKPYYDGTKILEFASDRTEVFVRAHGEGGAVGFWVARHEDIVGLSGEQIAKKFNMPNAPTKLSLVEIPAGQKLVLSVVGPNKFGSSAGAIQYKIELPTGARLPDKWFTLLGDL